MLLPWSWANSLEKFLFLQFGISYLGEKVVVKHSTPTSPEGNGFLFPFPVVSWHEALARCGCSFLDFSVSNTISQINFINCLVLGILL